LGEPLAGLLGESVNLFWTIPSPSWQSTPWPIGPGSYGCLWIC